MKKTLPTILHHKYSTEDGHVMAQIRSVEGYQGLMITRSARELRDGVPQELILPLKRVRINPSLLDKHSVAGMHVHHGSLASPFRFLKERHGIPMFIGFRGNDATAFPKRSRQNESELKKLFRTADRFFPVCEHLKREIVRLGCPEDKIRVLYGGVDLSRFQFLPRVLEEGQKVRFLAVGRFVEKKGFDDLIRAFAEVKRRRGGVKLVLIGQGPCEPQYRRLIDKLSLGRSVQLIPWVEYGAIHKQYARSHVFVAPSVTDASGNQEGIPNTLKEAMATGMPVVSTTHAGIPELVDSPASGLLVPERDVRKLAEAMLWLSEHPESWPDIGANARNKIERDFNLRKQLMKQKEYYDEVIRSPEAEPSDHEG